MKTVRQFTRDIGMLACNCASCVEKRNKRAAERKAQPPEKSGASTADANPRVDLNEIHRRFWAKLAGKE